MPINSSSVLAQDPRFADQRWLLDTVIDVVGPEWDQGRLHYYAGPCSPDHQAAFLALRGSIRKFDDFSRELVKVARHVELRGKEQLTAGHPVSASDDLFAAAIAYGAAQWPVYADGELLQVLEQKKNETYRAYAALADHAIEAVEVPYLDGTVPAYLHLPSGRSFGDGGEPLPCVVAVSGMDAFKELTLLASRDRFLARGMAVLSVDGPGQGSCLARGIWYDPARYGELGSSCYDDLAARPELDAGRIMVWGLSQGSFWATQLAAAEPRFAACSVMYTCFDPRNTIMFATQSPTFRQKFMFMTSSDSVEQLEERVTAMDVGPLSASLTMPYLVIAGEDDPLTDPQQTFEHLNHVPGPKELMFYTGEDHAPMTRGSGQLGPAVMVYAVDWLADRAAGRPLTSQKITIDSLGRRHAEPWGERQDYAYGIPLGADTLLGDTAATGLA